MLLPNTFYIPNLKHVSLINNPLELKQEFKKPHFGIFFGYFLL